MESTPACEMDVRGRESCTRLPCWSSLNSLGERKERAKRGSDAFYRLGLPEETTGGGNSPDVSGMCL